MPTKTVYTVTLPTNGSYKDRSSLIIQVVKDAERFVGVIEIAETNGGKVKYSRLAVRCHGTDGARRNYRLTKPGGREWYDASIVPGGSLPHAAPADLCDCHGFVAYESCKHTQALAAHYLAGHLG